MIKGFNENAIENPIRAHISIAFEKVSDRDEMLKKIVEELTKSFDAAKSAALIFVPTRNGTEEACKELNTLFEENKVENLVNKVDFYHAGLDSTSREEKYINFKQGKTLILVATKAFGMGMDIKNIHYVYHLSPSSTFEDYLQEVGRAGRNPEMLSSAGFSIENPIRTKCLYTAKDFDTLRDKLHKDQITWTHLNQVRKEIFDYVSKFRPITENDSTAFPLPLDLLSCSSVFSDKIGKETFFRICMYWLEKLNRIRLGVFSPTYLPINILKEGYIFQNIKSEEREKLTQLSKGLIIYKNNNFPDAENIMIGIQELRDLTNTSSTTELFRLLFKAQKCKLLVVERVINLSPTLSKMAELSHDIKQFKSPIIEATFGLVERILNAIPLGELKNFEPEELEEIVKPLLHYHFDSNNFKWIEKKGNKGVKVYTSEELKEKSKTDFIKKRSKFAFKILSFIPKVKHKTTIKFEKGYERPIVNQVLFNGAKSKESQISYIEIFKKDLYNLVTFISYSYINNSTLEYNIIDLMILLGIEDKGEDYLQNLIFISGGLGYIKGGGNLLPMGIELYIKDSTEFKDEIKESEDAKIREEFNDTGRMKQLRLLALECLSERKKSDQDRFIKQFFKCGTVKELISLLEEYFSENSDALSAFRQEALEKQKNFLNEQQQEVYEAPLDKNIQVIAGPGSGKTHTLTLRIARLIQEEKVSPENILVLAYNRAVVIELKERLGILFKDLGYSKLINRLKVFTFHGFAKYCLGELIDTDDFDEWTPKFIKTMKETPGLIDQKMGVLKYVFVDEFQDITTERLELLRFIAKPKKTMVCVIGDPNQSIYGYQRDQTGKPLDPKPYYEEFKKLYKPTEFSLFVNYRSYPEILEVAENLLSLNESRYPMHKLEAYMKPNDDKKYCDLVTWSKNKINWKDKVLEFLKYRSPNGEEYKQVAVMFRSNDEVFRAYGILKRENLGDVRIRIQGSKGSLYKTREFYHILSLYEKDSEKLLDKDYITRFAILKDKIIKKYQHWEGHNFDTLYCIILEFDKEKDDDSSYQDLIDFIKDVTYSDDGQSGKIYQNNIHKIKSDLINQEIVLTTMHKVKGIEYDSVIIPSSFSNLPTSYVPDDKIINYLEEERRLYYVAYTRAKKRLLAIQHHREISLDNNLPYKFDENLVRQSYGVKFNEGIDKFTLYWSASNFGINSFEYIRDNVKVGDSIILNKEEGAFTFWYVIHNNQKIAHLSKAMVNSLINLETLSGFVVSSVYVNTYEETELSDEKKGTSYSKNWNQTAKKRGYIYLIDFSGFGN